jgi:hypothetical protein
MQFIEVEFDDDWWLGWVVQRDAAQLLIEWYAASCRP